MEHVYIMYSIKGSSGPTLSRANQRVALPRGKTLFYFSQFIHRYTITYMHIPSRERTSKVGERTDDNIPGCIFQSSQPLQTQLSSLLQSAASTAHNRAKHFQLFNTETKQTKQTKQTGRKQIWKAHAAFRLPISQCTHTHTHTRDHRQSQRRS